MCRAVPQNLITAHTEDEKLGAIHNVLERCHQGDLVHIVCGTTLKCAQLSHHLTSKYSIPVATVHRDKMPHDAAAALQDFKAKKCPVLITDDIACGRAAGCASVVVGYDAASSVQRHILRLGSVIPNRAGRVAYTSPIRGQDRRHAQAVASAMCKAGMSTENWFHLALNDAASSHPAGSQGIWERCKTVAAMQ